MLENLSNLIIIIAAALGAITAAFLGGLTVWTFRDIRSRSRDLLVQILATVMVAVIPVAGILIYLMLRPRETLSEQYVRALEEESLLSSIDNQEFCPSCGRRVEGDMRFCPSCHTKLRNDCSNCGRPVHLSWDLCPYCGNGLQPELPQVKRAAAPRVAAARPAAPQVRPAARRPAPLPEPAEEAAAAEPVANGGRAVAVGSVLDRLGGAVEGMMNRVSGAKPASSSESEEDSH